MDFILQQITDWLKEMLISAIMGNLSGMFESVNNQVGEIATSVGRTPASFSPEIFIGFSQLSVTEFFVFRKMESHETKNHLLCGQCRQLKDNTVLWKENNC